MGSAVVGILLAAGNARRFGANKIAARLPDGQAVGLAAARALAGAVDELIVVTGVQDGETERMFKAAGYVTTHCANAAHGMGHSLVCGVRKSQEGAALLIALADMPFIDAASILAVSTALRNGAPIVVPRVNGKAGHPVGFQANFRDALLQVEGDRGARAITDQHSDSVHYLALHDVGIVRDIDTPADLDASA
jgi:molybdenum cofactor cytidylyltransferase